MKGMTRAMTITAVLIVAVFAATIGYAAVSPGMETQAETGAPWGVLFGLGAGVLGLTLSREVLTDIQTGLRAIYLDAFSGATPRWPRLAMKVPSRVRVEVYKFLAEVAKMRKWVGERELTNVKAYQFQIQNEDWELTIPVDRDDIIYDTLGMYKPMVQQMGVSAAEHPDELLFNAVAGEDQPHGLLLSGNAAVCYDGQNYFDTDHPRMGGLAVQSNLGTKLLSPTSYGSARAGMRSITDGRGRNMNINPDLLVVSPQNEATAKQILESEKLYEMHSDSVRVLSDNPYRNTAEILVLNELSAYPNYWYLFDTRKPIKPFIFQEVKEPDFQSFESMTDEHVFKNKEFLYGVDSIDNAGFALWQLAYMSDGTVE